MKTVVASGAALVLLALACLSGTPPAPGPQPPFAPPPAPPPAAPPVIPPPAPQPPERSRPEGLRWIGVIPGGAGIAPEIAPAADGSGDLFVLVRSSTVPDAVTLARRDASGAVLWTRDLSRVRPGTLAADRDGSVLVSSILSDGFTATVVRVSADGSREDAAYTAPLPLSPGGSPGSFDHIASGGGALAIDVFAPSHTRLLRYVPPSGAPVRDLLVDSFVGPLSLVKDWVVAADGALFAVAIPKRGSEVDGRTLPDDESVFRVAPSGAIGWTPLPAGVSGNKLAVLRDGAVAFVGRALAPGAPFDAPQTIVAGEVDGGGAIVELREVPVPDPSPSGSYGPIVSIGSSGEIAVMPPDDGTDPCDRTVVLVPAGGGAPVRRDLGRGYCPTRVAVTSDGGFVIAGRLDLSVRFGDADADVAGVNDTFVAVVDP